MPAFAEKREVQFITVYVVIMIFLGISKETTRFIFPSSGDQVYTIINFYFLSAVALMVLIAWLSQSHYIPQIPKVPPLWAVGVNFVIFYPLFSGIFNILFTGQPTITIPALPTFITEGVISFNENFIAFILLPALFPFGKGIGSIMKGSIANIKGYQLSYDVPTVKRVLYGLPSIAIITLMHVGAYSQSARTFSEFYFAIIIAFSMFTVMYVIKESFGFGAAEAAHTAWNLVLIGFRGSVI